MLSILSKLCSGLKSVEPTAQIQKETHRLSLLDLPAEIRHEIYRYYFEVYGSMIHPKTNLRSDCICSKTWCPEHRSQKHEQMNFRGMRSGNDDFYQRRWTHDAKQSRKGSQPRRILLCRNILHADGILACHLNKPGLGRGPQKLSRTTQGMNALLLTCRQW